MAEGPLRTAAEYRAAYRETLESIARLAAPLSEDDLRRETGCPGWTVQDCIAHVSALESIFIDRDPPPHQAPEAAHVRSSFGAFMENGVDYRRGWSKERLLDEYREVTAERLRRLEGIGDADLEQDARGLFGTNKLRQVLTIRIFDLWAHEQDIRRAVGNIGGFDGPAAQNARDRTMRGLAQHLVDRGVAPEGSTLQVELTEPVQARRAIVFADGRGRIIDSTDDPTVSLRTDCNTWTVLTCGRAGDPGAAARVVVRGDAELGRAYLSDMAITP